jgi:hypothetical protein
MTNVSRRTMNVKGADSWLAVILSAAVILGGIAGLILWATQSAYVIR